MIFHVLRFIAEVASADVKVQKFLCEKFVYVVIEICAVYVSIRFKKFSARAIWKIYYWLKSRGTDGLLKYAFAILKHCVDTMNSINILVVAFQYLGFAISAARDPKPFAGLDILNPKP